MTLTESAQQQRWREQDARGDETDYPMTAIERCDDLWARGVSACWYVWMPSIYEQLVGIENTRSTTIIYSSDGFNAVATKRIEVAG